MKTLYSPYNDFILRRVKLRVPHLDLRDMLRLDAPPITRYYDTVREIDFDVFLCHDHLSTMGVLASLPPVATVQWIADEPNFPLEENRMMAIAGATPAIPKVGDVDWIHLDLLKVLRNPAKLATIRKFRVLSVQLWDSMDKRDYNRELQSLLKGLGLWK